jgi:membrane fusion protein (multidrug efflux system)
MMKKRKNLLITVGAVAGLIGLYLLFEHFMYVTTDNAQVNGHFVMLAAKVGGYVSEVKVNEGQQVKKDDILAEIDSRDYENTLRQVSSDLVSVEAKRKDAEKSFRRIADLYSKGVVAQAQYDSASASYSTLKAQYDAISAQVAQAQLNLANTKVRAPSDGFIAKKSVEVGQLAAPGVPLIGFVGSDERWVTANFKETEIAHIRIGAPVTVEVDALRGRFHGKVEAISSATGATFSLLPPDNATGNFTKVVQRVPIKIVLQDLKPDDVEKLRVGLSAYVKVSIH